MQSLNLDYKITQISIFATALNNKNQVNVKLLSNIFRK